MVINTWNEPAKMRAKRSIQKFDVIMKKDCMQALRMSTDIRTYLVLITRKRKLAMIEPRIFPKKTEDSK